MKTKNSKFHFDNLFYFDPIKLGPFILYQIGDIYTDTRYDGEPHVQFCHEMSFIVSGRGTARVNNREYPLRQGDVLLTLYGNLHSMTTDDSDPMRFYYLGFNFDREDPEYPRYAGIETQLLSIREPLRANRFDVNNIFQMAFDEMINDDIQRELVIRSCIEQVLVYTLRTFGPEHPVKPVERYLLNNQEPVHDIVNYINNHFYDIRSLTDITDYVGYNYSHASKVFSACMGMSINQYYQKVRFQKALELLGAHFTVTQVAEKLGFDSIHSFSRAFKNHFGQPPTSMVPRS